MEMLLKQFDCSICQQALSRTAISTAGRSRSLEMRVITLSRLTRMPSQEDQQPLSGEHDLGVVNALEALADSFADVPRSSDNAYFLSSAQQRGHLRCSISFH